MSSPYPHVADQQHPVLTRVYHVLNLELDGPEIDWDARAPSTASTSGRSSIPPEKRILTYSEVLELLSEQANRRLDHGPPAALERALRRQQEQTGGRGGQALDRILGKPSI